MKIYFYDKNYNKYEISSIEYTQFNGKDTVVEYSKIDSFANNTNNVIFEGWLSLEQVMNKLEQIVEED